VDNHDNGSNGDFLHRLEGQYQRTRDDVNVLKSQQEVLQRDIGGLATNIQALTNKLDEKSRTNWPALGLAVAMFGISVPGLGWVTASYTNSALAPIKNATDLNSETLRHFDDRVRTIESGLSTEVADRRANQAATKVSLAEIESQFHALSNVENLRAAQQERFNSMLYETANPGKRYPNGTFFPTSIFQNGINPSDGSQ
jgi:hypothetical protein